MGVDNQAKKSQVKKEDHDEIDEIMNEIQSLQHGMVEAPKPKAAAATPVSAATQQPKLQAVQKAAPAPRPLEETFVSEVGDETGPVDEMAEHDELAEFHGSSEDESMEETLAGMKEEESSSGNSLLDLAGEDSMRDHDDQASPSNGGSEGSLTLSLKGSMTLKLKYDFEGQEVTIGFSDHSLRVTLSDGTEFKIPVGNKRQLRAV